MTNAQNLVADLHPSSSVFDLTAAELREEGYAADFIALPTRNEDPCKPLTR